MPEKRDLLLEGVTARDHAVQPVGGTAQCVELVYLDVVTAQEIVGHPAGVVGMEEALDRGLVAQLQVRVELVPRRAESGPPQQVGHQI